MSKKPVVKVEFDGGFGQQTLLRTNTAVGDQQAVERQVKLSNKFFGQTFKIPKKLKIARADESEVMDSVKFNEFGGPEIFLPRKLRPDFFTGPFAGREGRNFHGLYDHEYGHVLFQENLPSRLKTHPRILGRQRRMHHQALIDKMGYRKAELDYKIRELQAKGESQGQINRLAAKRDRVDTRWKQLRAKFLPSPEVFKDDVNLLYSEELFSDLSAIARANDPKAVFNSLTEGMNQRKFPRDYEALRLRDATSPLDPKKWRGKRHEMDNEVYFPHTFFAPTLGHVWNKHLSGKSDKERARILRVVYDQIVDDWEGSLSGQMKTHDIQLRNESLMRRIDHALQN